MTRQKSTSYPFWSWCVKKHHTDAFTRSKMWVSFAKHSCLQHSVLLQINLSFRLLTPSSANPVFVTSCLHFGGDGEGIITPRLETSVTQKQSNCSFGCCTWKWACGQEVHCRRIFQSFTIRLLSNPLEMERGGGRAISRTPPTDCRERAGTVGQRMEVNMCVRERVRARGCMCTYLEYVCTQPCWAGCMVLVGDLGKWAGKKREAKPVHERGKQRDVDL